MPRRQVAARVLEVSVWCPTCGDEEFIEGRYRATKGQRKGRAHAEESGHDVHVTVTRIQVYRRTL